MESKKCTICGVVKPFVKRKIVGSIPTSSAMSRRGNSPRGAQTKTILGGKEMLGGIGSVFGTGMKAARVADQVDAHVRTARGQVQNISAVAQQFDFVEAQLQQFAQIVSQSGDAMAAMQFQNLQAQINNIQGQIVNSLRLVDQELAAIDSLTDKIQG